MSVAVASWSQEMLERDAIRMQVESASGSDRLMFGSTFGSDGTRLERKLHTSLAEHTEADVVACFQATLEGKTS